MGSGQKGSYRGRGWDEGSSSCGAEIPAHMAESLNACKHRSKLLSLSTWL